MFVLSKNLRKTKILRIHAQFIFKALANGYFIINSTINDIIIIRDINSCIIKDTTNSVTNDMIYDITVIGVINSI